MTDAARSAVGRPELLELIPAHNRAVRVEPRNAGVIVWVQIRRRWWMGPPLGWVLPFRSEKGVALDVLGQEIFEACDGVSSVESIVEGFAARHQLRFHEAKHSVVTFLRWLMERNIVYLARDRQA